MTDRCIETLETRTLFCDLHQVPALRDAVASVIRVNFQPASAPVAGNGFLADAGRVFGDRGDGQRFGWSSDNAANTRDRNAAASADQAYDTLNHTQKGGSRSWEIAVPNGRYSVRLVAGDAGFIDSTFSFNLEGVAALRGKPTWSQRWIEATTAVEVRDGRLSLTNGSGAINNKISFLEITPLNASTAPTWVRGANLPVPLGEVAAGVVGNTMFVVGSGSNVTLAYDLQKQQWLPTDAFAQRPFYGDHHALEVHNGKLYLIGGLLGAGGKVQIFDPAKNTWTLGPSMPWDGGSVSTARLGNRIYAFGGVVGSTPTSYRGLGSVARAAYLDLDKNTWVSIAGMPLVRHHTATATDGKRIWIFGGRDGANTLTNGYSDVMVYDPARNTWQTSRSSSSGLVAMPFARSGMGKAIYANGEFHVMGGETLNGPGAINRVYDRVDVYDPASRTWRVGPKLLTPRHGLFPVLHAGAIYLPGGGELVGIHQSRLLEILQLQ